MQAGATKTMHEFRDDCERTRQFFESNGSSPRQVNEELAHIVLASLADTASVELFVEVGEDVRRRILRNLRHYRRTGRRELCYAHSGLRRDGRVEARAALATLAAAGLVPQSMTRIADPVPLFRGAEWIRGMGPLNERLAGDQTLLDLTLVGLAQEVTNAHAYPQRLTMSLLVTECERRNVDGLVYKRVAIRSCIATFALQRHVGMYFWTRFSLGHVFRMSVVREARPRGEAALTVKLDMGDKGRLRCRDMELLGLEEISCAEDGATE